ncbi:mandelate racemase/muconate lactonizing enzyme [Trichophyton tonsurans CBS 112818]|uniref:Mandelate racemase/muconate lactonizing enzyme n=1 Tax=Trichophyton tonsurans (strain CBS 112818) TaxID=647933 RepID=F2RU64_TRIT1|nr:mandelate racemase/muconate lactonizing enzyme [Trichophyton tonsurans CBS 112818]
MAKIKTIEHFRVLPRWLFVKITDEQGGYGWGESTLEGHSESIEGTLNAFSRQIQGYEADDIEHIWQTAWRQGFYRGGPVFMSALSGIDIALWDLKAKRLGVPIYQLLGGKVRNKISVYAWIGGDRPADVKAAASVERLKTVKNLGLDAALDFHGRLHKPMAKQLAKMVEPYQPLFIEEPLLSEHPEGIKQLSSQTTTPIALGERLYNRWDVKRFLEDSSVDILQPDISHCGGISELRRIAAMAETYDVAIAPHCPLGPIALAACMQVDLSIPNFVIQEMSLGIHYNTTESGEEYDITNYIKDRSVFDVKDGYVKALEGPGLGIEVDEEEVRRVSKGAKPWVTTGFFGPDGSIREW